MINLILSLVYATQQTFEEFTEINPPGSEVYELVTSGFGFWIDPIRMQLIELKHSASNGDEAAFKSLTEMAAKDTDLAVDAQWFLGDIFKKRGYDNGQPYYGGCFTTAAEWYEKAAKKGCVDAMYDLYQTLKMQRKEKEAIFWLEKAAQNLHRRALYEMGQYYQCGIPGVLTRNVGKATINYKLASRQGHQGACDALTNIYLTEWEQFDPGLDISHYNKQQSLLAQFEEYGGKSSPETQFRLAQLYEKTLMLTVGNSNHPSNVCFGVRYLDKALKFYERCAEKGHKGGQLKLGQFYQKGGFIPRDHVKAVHWFEKAAEQDAFDPDDQIVFIAQAQFELGRMYENGEGVETNDQKASAYYRLAWNNENEDVKRHLKRSQKKYDFMPIF